MMIEPIDKTVEEASRPPGSDQELASVAYSDGVDDGATGMSPSTCFV
jgi:hypothetical protein